MRQEELMPLKEGLKMELETFRKNPSYRGYIAKRDKEMDQVLVTKFTLIDQIKIFLKSFMRR